MCLPKKKKRHSFFNQRLCQRDMSGSMGFTEFKELAGALNGWKQNFVTMDRDRSGTIEAQEMQQALGSMGRNKDFILIQRWSSKLI